MSLYIELQENNNTVAVSNRVPISTPPTGNNNGNVFGAVSGVLQTGSNPLTISLGGGTPFVAAPGDYDLKLILEPASSPCTSQSYVAYVSLSYLRVPTK